MHTNFTKHPIDNVRDPNASTRSKYGKENVRAMSGRCLSYGRGKSRIESRISRGKQEISASRETLSLSSYRRRYVRGMNRRFGRHIGIPIIVQGSGPSRGQSPVE